MRFKPLPQTPLVGDASILLAMAIFGSYSLFLRLAPEIPSVVFLFGFQLVGFIGFALAGGIAQPVPRPLRKWIAVLVIAALLNDFFIFQGFRLTSVANIAFTHQTVSVFLAFLAPWLIGEETRREEWIALWLALGGVLLLLLPEFRSEIPSTQELMGIGLGLASAFFYAIILLIYRWLPAQIDAAAGTAVSGSTIVNTWRYGLSTLVLLPILPLLPSFEHSLQNIGIVAAFGILFAVIATALHVLGITRTRILHASILGKTEPLFAVLYAAAILGERPPLSTLIGGAMILCSGLFLIFKKDVSVTS